MCRLFVVPRQSIGDNAYFRNIILVVLHASFNIPRLANTSSVAIFACGLVDDSWDTCVLHAVLHAHKLGIQLACREARYPDYAIYEGSSKPFACATNTGNH